jgi:adenine/guanine phosphoribosyltransferase-like PRPP-binding protein
VTPERLRPGCGWVGDRLGLQMRSDPQSRHPVADLLEVALRRNPKRAHLLVSTVLGKHIPTDPRVVQAAGMELGRLAGDRLNGERALVIGYAETATGLGHLVAEALAGYYVHSTRRPVAGITTAAGFEESHSHATSHLLLPEDPDQFCGPEPLVLVDDELSTGATARATIAEMHRLGRHSRYVIAAIADMRSPAEQLALTEFAAELGVGIDVVALTRGQVVVPDGFAAAARAIVQSTPEAPAREPGRSDVEDVVVDWPAGVRDGGRHGFAPADVSAARRAAVSAAASIRSRLQDGSVLVLGTEELMYTPLLIALELAALGVDVKFSSTSRTPVVALDVAGYPIRSALTFPAHDHPADGTSARYAYNVFRPDEPFDEIVLVIDDVADTPELRAAGGLLSQLAAATARVHVVRLPSYRPVPA